MAGAGLAEVLLTCRLLLYIRLCVGVGFFGVFDYLVGLEGSNLEYVLSDGWLVGWLVGFLSFFEFF
mgnify:CR=1 FL=1